MNGNSVRIGRTSNTAIVCNASPNQPSNGPIWTHSYVKTSRRVESPKLSSYHVANGTDMSLTAVGAETVGNFVGCDQGNGALGKTRHKNGDVTP